MSRRNLYSRILFGTFLSDNYVSKVKVFFTENFISERTSKILNYSNQVSVNHISVRLVTTKSYRTVYFAFSIIYPVVNLRLRDFSFFFHPF